MTQRSRYALTLAVMAAPLSSIPVGAETQPPFYVEESGRAFYRLDDAVRAAGGNGATITIQPGTYKDCAAFEGGDVVVRAATPGSVIFDGVTCEGKAALVFRSQNATVDGIIFQNMRVPDGNGAGIRLERGNLTVTNSMFRNSEEGILTAADQSSSVTIDHSTFSGLGRCDRGLSCAHSVYIGDYGNVTVTRSRFEKGTGGHYFKSNAARNTLTDNSFDDSQGAYSNYMIDLPSGSVGNISGNVFVQGKNKENHSAFVAVAAENRSHPSAGLAISGNKASLAPGVGWSTVFVADWSHEPLRIGTNQLGSGIKPFETR